MCSLAMRQGLLCAVCAIAFLQTAGGLKCYGTSANNVTTEFTLTNSFVTETSCEGGDPTNYGMCRVDNLPEVFQLWIQNQSSQNQSSHWNQSELQWHAFSGPGFLGGCGGNESCRLQMDGVPAAIRAAYKCKACKTVLTLLLSPS